MGHQAAVESGGGFAQNPAAVDLDDTIAPPHFFQLTLAFFWLLAFSSATHDIAADGFYMLAMTEREQAFFSGIRSTFYRVAMICAQGGLVSLAGKFYQRTGDYSTAWLMAFVFVAGFFLCLGIYHCFILPQPPADHPGRIGSSETFFAGFFKTFGTFFQKPKIVALLLFLLLYRLGEAQLVKMVQLFLLDPREKGGLGLVNEQVGLAYGTIGVIALMLGGLLGGFVVARHGLKFWLWPMLLAIHLAGLRAAGQLLGDWHGRRRRAIRLRLRFHGVHALHDLHRARRTSDGALRDLHGLHGAGHDAAGHVERLVAGTYRLSAFLHLGAAGNDSELHRRTANPARGGVWPASSGRLN